MSWSVNTLPFLSGTRKASKNLGDTMRISPHGPFCPGGMTTPSMVKLDVDHPPPNGMTEVTAAACTPVSELRRGMSWFMNRIDAVSVGYFTAGSARLNVSTLRGSNPG